MFRLFNEVATIPKVVGYINIYVYILVRCQGNEALCQVGMD
jgi:hypothetical protein